MITWRQAIPVVAGYVIVAGAMAVCLTLVEPIAVSGGSMSPALYSGDVALVRRGAQGGRGDIVLLRRAGHLAVLHRIVRVETSGSLVTRGDANPIADFDVAAQDDVAGIVVATVPCGRAIEWWRTRGNRDTLSAQSDSARR